MQATNHSNMLLAETPDITALGEAECAVRAVRGSESKEVLSGFVGAPVLVALAGCLAFARELRDPDVRLALAGLLVAGALAWFLYACYLRKRIGKWITVYERGLVAVDRHGTQIMLWDQIESIRDVMVHYFYKGVSSHTNRCFELRGSDGAVLEFGGPPETIAAVGDAVCCHAYAHLEPRLLGQLAAGVPVDFGAVRLSPGAIETTQGTLPWSALQSMTVVDEWLRLYALGSQEPWAQIKRSDIRNSQVFFTAFQNMAGAAR